MNPKMAVPQNKKSKNPWLSKSEATTNKKRLAAWILAIKKLKEEAESRGMVVCYEAE